MPVTQRVERAQASDASIEYAIATLAISLGLTVVLGAKLFGLY